MNIKEYLQAQFENYHTQVVAPLIKKSPSSSGSSTPVSNVLYDDSGFDMTSIELMKDMLKGINIGNQFECYNNNVVDDKTATDKVLFYETLWGCPKVSKQYIEYLAQIGIDAVRLPVSWGNHIDSKNNLISIAWLERIKEVVDMIIGNGMYCIINVHHDGSHSWRKIQFDGAYKKPSMAYFCNLWYQIGDYFKDYGYKLLFEPYNEVTDSSGNMSPSTAKEAVTAQYAQAFLDIIRAQGGNNSKRFCVIPNYGGVHLMTNDTFKTLKDSATDKLLLTTHSYPSYDDAQSVLVGAKSKVNNSGVGVIIDEIGMMPADKNDLAFVKNLRKYADAYGVSTFWWDNGLREYNLVDRFYCEPTNAALSEYLGKSIPQKIYTEPFDNVFMPYKAKFYTPVPKSFSGKKKYLLIYSQKPITSIVAANNWQGYYAIKGNEGTLYTIYVSDDDVSYTLLETQLCSDPAKQIIGTKHILYGTTNDSNYVSGNYTIENAPTEPEAVKPDLKKYYVLIKNKTKGTYYYVSQVSGSDKYYPTVYTVNKNDSTSKTYLSITMGGTAISYSLQTYTSNDGKTWTESELKQNEYQWEITDFIGKDDEYEILQESHK